MIAILTKIKLKADDRNISATITWDSLNNELENRGGTKIDVPSFQERYDNDPIIPKLVSSFDNNGIILNTNTITNTDISNGDNEIDNSQVDMMAQRALNKRT